LLQTQFYARAVEKVLGAYLMEFGIPEAIWRLQVKDFLAIVTMDAHGDSLHAEPEADTAQALAELKTGLIPRPTSSRGRRSHGAG